MKTVTTLLSGVMLLMLQGCEILPPKISDENCHTRQIAGTEVYRDICSGGGFLRRAFDSEVVVDLNNAAEKPDTVKSHQSHTGPSMVETLGPPAIFRDAQVRSAEKIADAQVLSTEIADAGATERAELGAAVARDNAQLAANTAMDVEGIRSETARGIADGNNTTAMEIAGMQSETALNIAEMEGETALEVAELMNKRPTGGNINIGISNDNGGDGGTGYGSAGVAVDLQNSTSVNGAKPKKGYRIIQ